MRKVPAAPLPWAGRSAIRIVVEVDARWRGVGFTRARDEEPPVPLVGGALHAVAAEDALLAREDGVFDLSSRGRFAVTDRRSAALAPFVGDQRPEELIAPAALADQAAAQHRFTARAEFRERAVAAIVERHRAGLETVDAQRLKGE